MSINSPRQGASTLMAYFQSLLDRIIRPEQREKVYNRVLSFATDSPLYFTFFVLQLLTSAFPLILFITFTGSVLLLSLTASILFSLFWIGFALCLLIPTLVVTVILAASIFCWAVCSFLAGKWVYDLVSGNSMSTSASNESQEKMIVEEKKGQHSADKGSHAVTGHGDGVQEFRNGDTPI